VSLKTAGLKLFLLFCLLFVLLPQPGLDAALCDTVDIPASKMTGTYRAIVILPDDYELQRWPVVYLLHGWSGNYRNWYDKTDLPSLADQYQLIIVCPDGGYEGWYLDSPLDKSSQYDSYIAVDVVDYIDRHYRTIAKMEARALCGLSMGGHGAISLLARHPQRFGSAGSMSGVMRLTSARKRYGIIRLLGEFSTDSLRWKACSCVDLVGRLSGQIKRLLLIAASMMHLLRTTESYMQN